MKRALSLSLALGLLLGSCGPTIDPASRLESFRVLAVQKDKPYAKPGETVTLRMLLSDELEDAPRPVDVWWLAGCTNPLGDLYAGCGPQLAELDLTTDVGRGLEFSYPIPPDIIEAEREPPYGFSVVFFAACAGGTIQPDLDPELLLPVSCRAPDGKRLGADSFVIGYTQIYSYEAHTNTNPVVTGFAVDGKPLEPECVGEACVELLKREVGGQGVIPAGDAGAGRDAGSPDAGGDAGAADGGADGGSSEAGGPDAGAPEGGTPDGGAPALLAPCGEAEVGCIEACSKEDRTACPKIDLELGVDEASAERNTVIEELEGGKVLEQMWVNYYSDRGRLLSEVKLLNDATLGWNDEHEAELVAPKTAGPLTVWAVAHDNRGGAGWARVQLRVACPEGRAGKRCVELTEESSSTP